MKSEIYLKYTESMSIFLRLTWWLANSVLASISKQRRNFLKANSFYEADSKRWL